MSERRRIVLLVSIMTAVAMSIGIIWIVLLFQAAFAEEQARLVETAQSQARLLEAIARYDREHSPHYPGGPAEATLAQMRDAHSRYTGFGETGEFTLARREGDRILFLLSHRHHDLDMPQPILFDSELAEPMQRALSGQSGTVVGLDYRGERVLAAYEPVAELNLGIVAKIDLAEILAPFVRAALIAALSAIVLIAIGAVLFFRVTNPLLKSLEGSEKRFRAIFEQAPMGVALGDAAGHTLDANPALQQLLLYNRKDLLALGVTGTSHPDDLELDQELFNELVKGERDSYQIEKRFTRRDGQTVWGNLTVSIVHEAGTDPPLILGLLEDITERKRAEEALEAYSNRLEELVEERTQALTEAQERLVRQERLAVLGQLAGGVGHELRNPLGVISNAVYYLQATLSNADRTTQEYLIIISDQVKRAISIISDLLALAHTRTSEPELIQARDLLGSVLDHRPPPGEVHVVNQLPPHLPPLWVDSEQLREVLDRLVTNAYQAMPNGGDLRIDASVESGVVRISLSDTGTGIPQEHMDELFKPLFTTRARGIGLGLAISKNLVEINGGSIEVDSTEGVGSTFTLVLPGGEAAME